MSDIERDLHDANVMLYHITKHLPGVPICTSMAEVRAADLDLADEVRNALADARRPGGFAVCIGKCTYCGHTWRPLIELDAHGGFLCTGLECSRCQGPTGHVSIVVGTERDEASARARAEALVAEEH